MDSVAAHPPHEALTDGVGSLSALQRLNYCLHEGHHEKKSENKILCHLILASFSSCILAGVTGFEPATSAVTGQRSNQLSYTPVNGERRIDL